ncbi:hypothetical protein AAIH16_44230, partial [Pseudomonas aeruginosa]
VDGSFVMAYLGLPIDAELRSQPVPIDDCILFLVAEDGRGGLDMAGDKQQGGEEEGLGEGMGGLGSGRWTVLGPLSRIPVPALRFRRVAGSLSLRDR